MVLHDMLVLRELCKADLGQERRAKPRLCACS